MIRTIMDYTQDLLPTTVLHWNYRGFTEFPIHKIKGEEAEITDIYLKENLITRVPSDIAKLEHLESLYLSGNDITELPKEISQLRCLKCLDLSGNRLKYVPEEIGEVRSLKILILDENELVELPLRLAELRSLRYLSVCDNKLQWLPQRPVYNYYHCEFRFWRNINLKAIPYSLWYHMFRDQQTRSLNIGCLTIPKHEHVPAKSRCRLKLKHNSREWDIAVTCPPQHCNIFERDISAPSLFELAKRTLYQIVCDTAHRLNVQNEMNLNQCKDFTSNYMSLETDFQGFNLESDCDLNGNNLDVLPMTHLSKYSKRKCLRKHCVPADIVEEYLSFLPNFIKRELQNGPVSRCENVGCKRPVFDYAVYGFCFGKIILIDNTEDVILSAVFCTKNCADRWKIGKSNLIPWTLI